MLSVDLLVGSERRLQWMALVLYRSTLRIYSRTSQNLRKQTAMTGVPSVAFLKSTS